MDTTVGASIRALRERGGVRAVDLAERAGLTPSQLSRIESGERAVKASELAAIAAGLGVSPIAILDDDSLLASLPVAARAVDGLAVESTGLARLQSLAELDDVLRAAGVDSWNNRLAEVPSVSTEPWLRAAEILASWARSNMPTFDDSSTPFDSLVKSIESDLGVDVIVESHTKDSLLGAAITHRTFPCIFVNASQARQRVTFTLAHELGHVLSGTAEPLTADSDLTARTPEEKIANAFAASFLMPEQAIREMTNEWGRGATAIARMMLRFGVSYESLTWRLRNIGMIDGERLNSLRSLGWTGVLSRVDEPELVEELLSERNRDTPYSLPTPLTVRTLRGVRVGAVSVRPLAALLDVSPDSLLQAMKELESDPIESPSDPDVAESDDERYELSPI